jgi:hypothetical protein
MMRNDYYYMTWTTFSLLWMYDLEALMNRFRINLKYEV